MKFLVVSQLFSFAHVFQVLSNTHTSKYLIESVDLGMASNQFWILCYKIIN